MIIYRILSAIVTIFITVPIFILMCVTMFVYALISGLCYRSFIEQKISDVVLEKLNIKQEDLSGYSLFIIKLSMVFAESLSGLINNIKIIKKMKL